LFPISAAEGTMVVQAQATAATVTLQVYDFLEQGFNGLLRQVGTGGFHCAVQIFNKEWSFRKTWMGTGVYWIHPKTCTGHKFRESVPMGKVAITEEQFFRLLGRLKKRMARQQLRHSQAKLLLIQQRTMQRTGSRSHPRLDHQLVYTWCRLAQHGATASPADGGGDVAGDAGFEASAADDAASQAGPVAKAKTSCL